MDDTVNGNDLEVTLADIKTSLALLVQKVDTFQADLITLKKRQLEHEDLHTSRVREVAVLEERYRGLDQWRTKIDDWRLNLLGKVALVVTAATAVVGVAVSLVHLLR